MTTLAGNLLLKHTKMLRWLRADGERDLKRACFQLARQYAGERMHLDRHQHEQHSSLSTAGIGAARPTDGNCPLQPGLDAQMGA